MSPQNLQRLGQAGAGVTAALPWQRVLARAATVTGVSVGEICGPSRRREICRVRWAVLFARQQRAGWTAWGNDVGKFEPVGVAA